MMQKIIIFQEKICITIETLFDQLEVGFWVEWNMSFAE